MARSPFTALIMSIIPIVNLYLIYKWWVELRDAKKSDKNPIIWTLLMLIPIVNIYVIYSLYKTAERVAHDAKKEAYAIGVEPLFIAGLVLLLFGGIGVVIFLYMIYRTQEIFNECGV
jgi:hypothetical protein